MPVVERAYQSALDRFKNGLIDAHELFASCSARLLKLNEVSACQGDLVNALLSQKQALGVL